MFDKLIGFSLNNRLFVISAALAIMAYGVLTLRQLPVDVFPDLNRPTVTIFSEAEGLAPEEVETLVTLPIETVMNGASGVMRVRSASAIGLSIVWVEFDWSMDVYKARQIVNEKLAQTAAVLPSGIRPVLGPISSIMGEIMLIGMTSDNKQVNPMELRSLADWTLRPRLLAIPGLAQVTIIGGEKKQYQVLLDPEKMIYHSVTFEEVRTALENANVNSTGGFLFEAYQERLIRNLARVKDLDDIRQAVLPKKVEKDAPPLTIGDVGEVRLGGPLGKRGDAGIGGEAGVMLSVQKQPGADTIGLTKKVEGVLADIEKTLPQGVKLHLEIFEQARFIDRAIDNVFNALRDGSILVVVVLFIFLLNLRTTFITLTAIPLSLIITALVFKAFGFSINTMTLGGLAVAVGELVDDAIVDVENVFRRLRENRQLENPKPVTDVIREASVEIRSSIVFATIIVILVFVPLFAMGGIEGRIFMPLGIAYIVSILASLVVAVTVTPALCSYLLPNMKSLSHKRDGLMVRLLKAVQRGGLAVALKLRWLLLGVTFAGFVWAVGVSLTFGKEFLPPFNEGSATINILSVPGTSLAESNRIGTIAEKLIMQLPEVMMTGRRTGRAELDDHAEGVHSTEIEVELKEGDRVKKEVMDDIRGKLATIPGIVVNIGQPISHRIDHILSGVRAQIAIKIFGDDLDKLRDLAEETRVAMSGVKGVVDLQVEKQVLVPQLHIRIDRSKALAQGVMAGEIADMSELALQGKTVSQVIEGQRIYDLVVRLNEKDRANAEDIAKIPMDTVWDTSTPLGLVADIQKGEGPNIINREDVRRRIVISANVAGRDLVRTVEEIKKTLNEKVHLPQGYYYVYGGQFEAQASASKMLSILGLVSLLAIFVVLYSHFNSVNLALQVMVGIPLAFIGAVAGVWATGGIFSVATLVGFITLTGIAARNGIMMIAHYLHLMQAEGEKFSLQMLYRGSQERLVPVLMTALTALMALVPLILAADEPGKEILHPVAVVIFYGLLTSTALNLIVTPLIFWMFGEKTVRRLVPIAFNFKQ
ncbi:MAG: efflux RND transporter permease subunit [bacterium]|nr:efflux RND transporter permease subunit [bacterium]